MLFKEIIGNHLYVYWRGRLLYKQWLDANGRKIKGMVMYEWGNL